MDTSSRISRRTVLKAVPAAAALVAAPNGLLTPQRAFAQIPGFPEPPVWYSGTPVLAGTLHVRFTEHFIPPIGRIVTRTYSGMLPGPTLRLRRGQTLGLKQINNLPPNGPFNGDHNTPHHFNSFNLHTHGLHVSPSGIADNVFREFFPRGSEGYEPHYFSTIEIPANHPAGTFWYHPHNHGAVSMQLAGGMAGVLIIEGDIDEVPEIAAAADVVVCINELKIKNGTVPDFTKDGVIAPEVGSTFTVNGVVQPTLTMRPGEVQRWRLVAANGFTRLTPLLTGPLGPRQPEMYQIAQDGVTFPAPVFVTDGVPMGMGNRADVLVRALQPGTFVLRSNNIDLMTVRVEGDPVVPPMDVPDTLPQGKPFLDPGLAPTVTREVGFRVDENVFPYDHGFPNAYRILGTNETPPSAPGVNPLLNRRYGRFDPDYVNHTLTLGNVERWKIGPTVNHPFHLHTNHFLVVSQNGTPLNPPVWQDTLSSSASSEILVKYEDFTGRAVLHCHNIKHEDLGMMQVINYVNP
jgi:FtsP/CotA-like multicopper oxidase with cupredoxin domain